MKLKRVVYYDSKNHEPPSNCFMCEDSNDCLLEQYTDSINSECEFAIRGEDEDGELITMRLVPLGNIGEQDGIEHESTPEQEPLHE